MEMVDYSDPSTSSLPWPRKGLLVCSSFPLQIIHVQGNLLIFFTDVCSLMHDSKCEQLHHFDLTCPLNPLQADPTPHDAGKCQGLATMTDAELLAVNELANGIRQR